MCHALIVVVFAASAPAGVGSTSRVIASRREHPKRRVEREEDEYQQIEGDDSRRNPTELLLLAPRHVEARN